MSEPVHAQVQPLPSHDGWVLRCTEYPEVILHLKTLDHLGPKALAAIASAANWSDTTGKAVDFEYPRGPLTLYQVTREPDGALSCNQVPGVRLSGQSQTRDIVHSIALATGSPPDSVGITFEPF
ncbi:hypothetical protein GCM10009616_40660 [Microlunatus lacustris]